MNCEEALRSAIRAFAFDEAFTEAVLELHDASRLCFCHRVGERWAKAVGPEGNETDGGTADELLAAITMFRLNRKHLDIQFQDGSRWDESLLDLDVDNPEADNPESGDP